MVKQTKQLLMESGKELMCLNGYTLTRVEDVTKKAEVAKGTFYIYFKSKEELFIEIISEETKSWNDYLEKIIKENIEFREKIILITSDFIKRTVKNKGIIKVMAEINQGKDGKMGKNITKSLISNRIRIIERIMSFFVEASKNVELDIKYNSFIQDIAILYNTLISEYILRKITNGNIENNSKMKFINKYENFYESLNNIEIEKESKFITDIFLNGVKRK